MQNYESGLLTQKELDLFLAFHEKHIGTDFEVNEDPGGSDRFYVMVFELEPIEVDMLARFEDEHFN